MRPLPLGFDSADRTAPHAQLARALISNASALLPLASVCPFYTVLSVGISIAAASIRIVIRRPHRPRPAFRPPPPSHSTRRSPPAHTRASAPLSEAASPRAVSSNHLSQYRVTTIRYVYSHFYFTHGTAELVRLCADIHRCRQSHGSISHKALIAAPSSQLFHSSFQQSCSINPDCSIEAVKTGKPPSSSTHHTKCLHSGHLPPSPSAPSARMKRTKNEHTSPHPDEATAVSRRALNQHGERLKSTRNAPVAHYACERKMS